MLLIHGSWWATITRSGVNNCAKSVAHLGFWKKGQGLSVEAYTSVRSGVCSSPANFSIFWMKMACSDALWNTVLKLVCLQQKASHQTSMHYACATRGGHRRMSPKYATARNYSNITVDVRLDLSLHREASPYTACSHCNSNTKQQWPSRWVASTQDGLMVWFGRNSVKASY